MKLNYPKEFDDQVKEIESKKIVTVDDFISVAKLALELRKKYPKAGESMFWTLFYLQRDYFWPEEGKEQKPELPYEIDNVMGNLVDVYDMDLEKKDEGCWKWLEEEIEKYEKSKNNS